jgi:hypothetical protein
VCAGTAKKKHVLIRIEITISEAKAADPFGLGEHWMAVNREINRSIGGNTAKTYPGLPA